MKKIFIIVVVVNLIVTNAVPEQAFTPLLENEDQNIVEITTYSNADKQMPEESSALNLPEVETNYDVTIDENPPNKEDIDFQGENYPLNFNEEYVPMKESDSNYNDLINKDPKEIMETAAGFVPVPIFKKRKSSHKQTQKPHKQFAHKRYFKRPYNPYRRQGTYYYFYPYYRYYFPGSLRFY